MNHFWNKIIRGMRNNILIGLFLLMPLVGTLWILGLVISFVSNNVLPSSWLASKYAPLFRIAALIVAVAVLYFVGLLTRNFIGRKIFHLADYILTRIPVISSVYTSIRQISESLVNTQSTLFKEVVAVQFPRPGLFSIGFVTAHVPEMLANKLMSASGSDEKEWISIFVPTTPNPTTGFFLMLPKSGLIYLNISVAGAMKMLISAGVANPWKNDGLPKQTLLDYIEAWLKRGESANPPDSTPLQGLSSPEKE